MSLASWKRFEAGDRQATLEQWINAAWMLGCYFEDLVGVERLRTWTATPEYPEAPDADETWAIDVEYDVVLARLAAFADSRRG